MFFQDALCSAYVRIAKSCPVHIWRPESLIHMLCFSNQIYNLVDFFHIAISRLAPHFVEEGVANHCSMDLLTSGDGERESLRIGGKRPALEVEPSYTKRQKLVGEEKDFGISCQDINKFACAGEREYACHVFNSLNQFVEDLVPSVLKTNSLNPEVALTALSTLSIAFFEYPHLSLSRCISRQLSRWIRWMSDQVD